MCISLCVLVHSETGEFKIDTTRTYHRLTLKSVMVSVCVCVCVCLCREVRDLVTPFSPPSLSLTTGSCHQAQASCATSKDTVTE